MSSTAEFKGPLYRQFVNENINMHFYRSSKYALKRCTIWLQYHQFRHSMVWLHLDIVMVWLHLDIVMVWLHLDIVMVWLHLDIVWYGYI